MVLHLCPAFDNENALIIHAVGPPGYEERPLAQSACHTRSGDEIGAHVTDLALKGTRTRRKGAYSEGNGHGSPVGNPGPTMNGVFSGWS